MTYLSVSPWLASVRAIPARSLSPKAAAEVRETRRNCEKDVKTEQTNPVSHLESTKASKNELKTNSKNVPKTRQKAKTNSKNVLQTPVGIGDCLDAQERK
jgi:hypothetical protein